MVDKGENNQLGDAALYPDRAFGGPALNTSAGGAVEGAGIEKEASFAEEPLSDDTLPPPEDSTDDGRPEPGRKTRHRLRSAGLAAGAFLLAAGTVAGIQAFNQWRSTRAQQSYQKNLEEVGLADSAVALRETSQEEAAQMNRQLEHQLEETAAQGLLEDPDPLPAIGRIDTSTWTPRRERAAAVAELQPFVDTYGDAPTFLQLPVRVKGVESNGDELQPSLVPARIMSQDRPGAGLRPLRIAVLDSPIQPSLKPGFMEHISWKAVTEMPLPGTDASTCRTLALSDTQAHGSKVAWVISSVVYRTFPNLPVQIEGVPLSPGCPNDIKSAQILASLDWIAQQKFDLVNISLTFVNIDVVDQCPEPLQKAITRVVDSGAVVVAAAGNSGNYGFFPPVTCRGVIAVGSAEEDSTLGRSGTANRKGLIYTQSMLEVPDWIRKDSWVNRNDGRSYAKQPEKPIERPAVPAGFYLGHPNYQLFSGTSAATALATGVLSTWLAQRPKAQGEQGLAHVTDRLNTHSRRLARSVGLEKAIGTPEEFAAYREDQPPAPTARVPAPAVAVRLAEKAGEIGKPDMNYMDPGLAATSPIEIVKPYILARQRARPDWERVRVLDSYLLNGFGPPASDTTHAARRPASAADGGAALVPATDQARQH